MIHRLRTGLIESNDTEAQPTVMDESARLVRRALLVYEGDFDSMDGPVKVSSDDLTNLASNHNEQLKHTAKLAGIGESEISMKDYPPVQLDHSVSAKDTVGRLVGPIDVESYVTKDGKEVLGVFGNVCILGQENIEKVLDGRWTHLSVGVDFEKGKFSELTITPFPAAPEASLLSERTKMSERRFEIDSKSFTWQYDEQSKKFAILNAAGQQILEADSVEEAKRRLEKDVKAGRLSKLAGSFVVGGKKFAWNERADGEIDILTDSGELVGQAPTVEKAKSFIEYELNIGRLKLTKGDPMDKELKKKKMAEEEMKKLAEEESAEDEKKESAAHEAAESKAEEKAEHEKMKKMAEECDEDEAHLSADEDKDDEKHLIVYREKGHRIEIQKTFNNKYVAIVDDHVESPKFSSEAEALAWGKKMVAAYEEDELSTENDDDKKLAEEEKKAEMAKLRSMREQIKKLSTDFRKTSEHAQLAAKRGSISTRLAKLRADAKITPAEVKKIDIVKLAKEADSTINAVLKSYEDREPVVMVGAMGSMKAESLATLGSSHRMSQLEMETRRNMTLLRNTIPTTKRLNSQSPDEVSIHIDTSPHLDLDTEHAELVKMLDEGKIEDVKERMKSWMKKLQYGTSPSTMASAEETEKHLSSLAESARKMQTQFDELQKLAGTLVGL